MAPPTRRRLLMLAFFVTMACLQVASGAELERQQNDCKQVLVNGQKESVVCLCDKDYCDDIRVAWPEQRGHSVLVVSTKSGHRMSVRNTTAGESWFGAIREEEPVLQLQVNTSARFQDIMGWGGAFTDATGFNLRTLSKPMADKLLEGYYGSQGLEYTFGRVPLGGSDFSTRDYTYDDAPEEDLELDKWHLAPEDTEYKIPYLQQAAELVKARGSNLKLFASPWSAPRWMKSTNSLVRGFLKDEDRFYRSYANYVVRFYEAYRKHGVKFWGATVQNEPLSAFLHHYFFNSMQMEAGQMGKFISEYLGPALEARNYTRENFKLMVGDDNLGVLNTHVADLLRRPEVARYVSGLAYHWYESAVHVPHQVLEELHQQIRDKIEFVMMSEACTGWERHDAGPSLGHWGRGERYAYDIMEDLKRHTGAWIDWNMALNLEGGPNWARNFVDSPVIVNADKDEFYRQPMYYVLAHFSRFFRPGSVRVHAQLLQTSDDGNLNAVAVLNRETGHLIVNLLNRHPTARLLQLADLSQAGSSARQPRPFRLEPASMSTLIIKL